MVWTMRILGRIAVGVMHSVKNGICPGRKVRASLTYPSKYIKELFPKLVHNKHLMGRIPVQKETLAKEGEIPMKEK